MVDSFGIGPGLRALREWGVRGHAISAALCSHQKLGSGQRPGKGLLWGHGGAPHVRDAVSLWASGNAAGVS